MNRKETCKIMAYMQAEKPHSFQSLDANLFDLKIELWSDSFEEIPYESVLSAVKSFMVTDATNFAPGIGQIMEIIYQANTPPENKLTGEEIWNTIIIKALRNSGYKAVEEFDNLPEQAKKIVGSPAILNIWGKMSTEQLNKQVKYNFVKSYENSNAQNKENIKISKSVKKILSRSLPDALKNNEVDREEPKKLN